MTVKKPSLFILVIIFTGLVLLGLGDSHVSTAGLGNLGSETTSSVSEANNSSASATIETTVYTSPHV